MALPRSDLRETRGLSCQPCEELVHQRAGQVLADSPAMFRITTSDAVFDLVESGDTQQRLVNDGRALLWLGLDQLSAAVCPAEGQTQRIAARAFWRGEVGVAAIGIDLDRAVEAIEDFCGIFAVTSGPIMEHHARRRRSVPAAVVAQNSPEITGFRLAAPRIQHRGRSLVDIQSRAFRHQAFGHMVYHRRDRSARPPHPIRQDRAVDRHSVSGHDSRLPVQRHMFGMFGHGNLRQ
uniref:Uncharacterized protein n=1 Tax=Plasmid Ti TaxID=2512 RepID=Q52596_9ZZZZ|nr:unknown protein [Plasmid Ti]